MIMEKIKSIFANCEFFSKKTLAASYYGMITWAAVLIVLGLPLLGTYAKAEDPVIIVGMVIMAIVVEIKSGGFALFGFLFDLVVGAVGCVTANLLLKLKFMAALSRAFTIPRMRVLVVLVIVAMFAQTRIGFKPEVEKK